MTSVHILGSTGSIGTQAIDVISRNREHFDVVSLAAGGAQLELLARQASELHVQRIGIARKGSASDFAELFRAIAPNHALPEIVDGADAATQLASGAAQGDVLLNGMTGSIGLEPTLAALRSGARVALANKESLVAGGALVREAMSRPGQIYPVDSEHSAIAQALRSGVHHRGLTSPNLDGESEVRRIILTASGGPVRGKTREELRNVTPSQALNHPTWNMGPVVTINSSTLMNKALELIEAAYLFDVSPDAIVPVVHPQSIVHSMVEFRDGATIAQASPPDMRLPIALGLSAPMRLDGVTPSFDWTQASEWTFEPLDNETFPAVSLAREAVAASPLHPAALNAANEECVEGFIRGQIGYLDITDIVARVLSETEGSESITFEAVTNIETWARMRAHELMLSRA
ncbi:MAG: 1-deoxy-D-xylulose-5-phosphate reductoisomerase [Actinomycetaceae bacterium]|nr:1-deoxy-D-xylulose-5-phosphate reductoisomerase [Arcanobacterium sp.]MDD7504515.1 1-deoxy-D-xylulose-5-phosphate reductoisomerase [Actinomycetaceae bacterium]MDY6142816.1 1-deoxy-D-xylulose-5-phosphate reductoisomerase [Arcanobacterium sp.]